MTDRTVRAQLELSGADYSHSLGRRVPQEEGLAELRRLLSEMHRLLGEPEPASPERELPIEAYSIFGRRFASKAELAAYLQETAHLATLARAALEQLGYEGEWFSVLPEHVRADVGRLQDNVTTLHKRSREVGLLPSVARAMLEQLGYEGDWGPEDLRPEDWRAAVRDLQDGATTMRAKYEAEQERADGLVEKLQTVRGQRDDAAYILANVRRVLSLANDAPLSEILAAIEKALKTERRGLANGQRVKALLDLPSDASQADMLARIEALVSEAREVRAALDLEPDEASMHVVDEVGLLVERVRAAKEQMLSEPLRVEFQRGAPVSPVVPGGVFGVVKENDRFLLLDLRTGDAVDSGPEKYTRERAVRAEIIDRMARGVCPSFVVVNAAEAEIPESVRALRLVEELGRDRDYLYERDEHGRWFLRMPNDVASGGLRSLTLESLPAKPMYDASGEVRYQVRKKPGVFSGEFVVFDTVADSSWKDGPSIDFDVAANAARALNEGARLRAKK